MARSSLLTVGLSCLRKTDLVILLMVEIRFGLFVYGGNGFRLSCLQFPRIQNWIWTFYLAVRSRTFLLTVRIWTFSLTVPPLQVNKTTVSKRPQQ